MKYKALLIDIDNTLYNYNSTHIFAKKAVLQFCKNELKIDENITLKAYDMARKKFHIELNGTAASHNRILYFQNMCEILNINPLKFSSQLYEVYWDTFLEKIVAFEGVYELFKKYKNKICLITDLTAHIQYRKIAKLGLSEYCKHVVTSEEAGKEKPHPYIFMLALRKLKLKANQVCMIGDNFEKDIFGACNLGLHTIWFNHQKKDNKINKISHLEVKSFKEILELI